MSDINSTSREECIASKTGATHFHAQLGLPDKVCAIKGLVVSYLCCSMANINDQWYGSMDKPKVRNLVPWCGQDGIELKYRNTP